MKYTFLIIFIFFSLCEPLLAQQEVILKSGERIQGSVITDASDFIILESKLLGPLTVQKQHIEKMVSVEIPPPEAPPEKVVEWKRNLEIGYNLVTGNTETSAFSFGAGINRKAYKNETTLKGNYSQSSSDSKMDSQKWYGLARWAWSMDKQRKWYNYYRTEVDHDKFANIDYRVTPAGGIGYWFSDELPIKALAEIGAGYEYTSYNNDTEDEGEAILTPRIYFEWNILADAILSEEFLAYPSLSDLGEYRFKSITSFLTPITDQLAIKVSLIDEYDSEPAEDARENDLTLTSSLAYSF